MVYVSRKLLYPAFIVIFSIVFFIMVYLFSISQSLVVEEARFELAGDSLVFYSTINNISNSYVRDISVDLIHSGGKTSYRVEDIPPNESREVVIKDIVFSDDLVYDIFILAPFNRTIRLPFVLEEDTIRPVTAEVFLTGEMVVGEDYDYIVKLCNVSNNALIDVRWSASTNESYFDQPLIPQVIDLGINQCKNLNSTLTPIKSGIARLKFVVSVERLEQSYQHEIFISE